MLSLMRQQRIRVHKPGQTYDRDVLLQTILAQPIRYMRDPRCMFCFLSTYDETNFFKQEYINGTVTWMVKYSPVVSGSVQ
jgi:hypothetical protein